MAKTRALKKNGRRLYTKRNRILHFMLGEKVNSRYRRLDGTDLTSSPCYSGLRRLLGPSPRRVADQVLELVEFGHHVACLQDAVELGLEEEGMG